MPKRNPIKRVAVLLEMEDGELLAVYSEPDPVYNDAEVEFKMDRPVEHFDWAKPGDRAGRSMPGQMDASIHVDHLHAATYIHGMPAMTRTVLDAVKSAARA